jgi:REP element-mobilizing transposase RayT
MAKTIGYFVTWTTYGAWLQGDKRGYVKKGKVLGENKSLYNINKMIQTSESVRLRKKERKIISQAISKRAKELGQAVLSIAVCSNHVHILLGYNGKPIEDCIRQYKTASYYTLKENGFNRKLWTRGYDVRFCFDEKHLKAVIEYVKRHGEGK